MQGLLRKLGAVARDVAYGINAGHAIRHGLPVPAHPLPQSMRAVEAVRGHKMPGAHPPR